MSSVATLTQALGFKNLLEPTGDAEFQLIEQVREGLPLELLQIFIEQDILSREDVERIIGKQRTLARRKAKNERLNQTESDKLLRTVRVVLLAVSVFGTTEKANQWFYLPNIALSNREPHKLLDTDFGVKMIEKILNRIEYGIYS